MTLPSSGNSISLSQLRTEYTNLGSSAEVKLSSFYYGASQTKFYLPRNNCTDAVRGTVSDSPTHPGRVPHLQGIPQVSNPIGNTPIRFSQFYGKTYYYAPITASSINGSNNAQSFSPSTIENQAPDGKQNNENAVFIDLNVTGECRASSTGSYALTIGTKQRTNTTVWINVTGNVKGKGGAGGKGNCVSAGGESGGPALQAQCHTFLNNTGRIYGGGAGGSGGSNSNETWNECWFCGPTNRSYGGGGGGGGSGGGPGGPGGPGCSANFNNGGNDGGSGGWGDAAASGGGGGSPRGGGGGNYGNGSAFVKSSGMYYKRTSTGTILGASPSTPST
jgi:hypothetical protein